MNGRLLKLQTTGLFAVGLLCVGVFGNMQAASSEGFESASSACDELESQLSSAALDGELEEVRRLVEMGVDVDGTAHDGSTALIEAAGEGHLEVVQYLVAMGANVNHERGYGTETVLHRAARNSQLEVVRYLVENEADTERADYAGSTALSFAVENEDFDMVQYLLEEGVGLTDEDEERFEESILDTINEMQRRIEALQEVGGEWRPENHERLPEPHRLAIRMLLTVAKLN